jgi:hypothetical protein
MGINNMRILINIFWKNFASMSEGQRKMKNVVASCMFETLRIYKQRKQLTTIINITNVYCVI